MPFTIDQAPVVAAALMNLRGDTLASISKATDIRVANLSVWLRGKEQVISQKRVVALLDHLGVRGGKLRRDALHQWVAKGTLDDLKKVLDALLEPEEKAKFLILTEENNGYPQVSFIGLPSEIGFAWSRVVLETGLLSAPKLTPRELGFGQLLVTEANLSNLPADDINFLNETSDYELHSGTTAEKMSFLTEKMFRLPKRDIQSAEFSQLQTILVRVINGGVSPAEISQLLTKNYLA